MSGGRPACWSHGEFTDATKCKHCGLRASGKSASRLKSHLRGCEKAPEAVKQKATDAPTTTPKRKAPGTDGPAPAKRMALGVPLPSASERAMIDIAWCRFIFSTASAFRVVENPYFQAAIEATRPGLKLSLNRRNVGGSFLDKVYEEVTRPIRPMLQKSKRITLLLDGWTTERQEKVVTVCVKSKQTYYILYTAVLDEKTHDAGELLGHMKTVCTDFAIEKKVSCIVADGDSTVQSASKQMCKYLEEEVEGNPYHPKRVICGAHLMSRCTNDLLGTRRENHKDTGNEFHPVFKLCTATVASIRNVEAIGKRYAELQVAAGCTSKKPPTPCVTRWTTIGAAFAEFIKHKSALLVIFDEYKTSLPHLGELLEKWDLFVLVASLVDTATACVNVLQADDGVAAYIIPCLSTLVKKGEDVMKDMKAAEKTKMKEVVKKWKARLQKAEDFDYMVAATYLTPIFHVEGDMRKGVTQAYKVSATLQKKTSKYLKDLHGAEAGSVVLSFAAKTGVFDDEDLWAGVGTESSSDFWDKAAFLASEIATAQAVSRSAATLTGYPSSTAMVERTFSHMKWQNEGRRNRLVAEKIHKLTCVHRALMVEGDASAAWWSPEEVEADEKKKQQEKKKDAEKEGGEATGSVPTTIVL